MTYYKTMTNGTLTIPVDLLRHFSEIFPSSEAFLVWQFLWSNNTNTFKPISPSEIATSIDMTTSQVNTIIASLISQDLVEVIDKDTETIFDAQIAFKKLDQLVSETKDSSDNELQQVIKDYETEFGRLLTPMELEEIQKLIKEQNTSAAIIRAALKQAVFSGNRNLRYVMGILRNWRHEGITTVEQIEANDRHKKRENQKEAVITDSQFAAMKSLWGNHHDSKN